MKKYIRGLASISLKTTLFLAAVLAAVLAVAGTPTNIKHALVDAKVYDSLVSNVLDSVTEQKNEETTPAKGEELDINQPAIKQAANTALTPTVLQNSTEQIIDGVYNWLDGEVETPDFNVDLSGAKQQFITAAGQAAETHVASLPVCTTAELQTMTPDQQENIFSLTCRPSSLTPAAANQQIVSSLSSSEDFLKDTSLTAGTLKNDEGKTPFDDLKQIPDQYQKAKKAPLLLLGISLLLDLAVFFLSETKRRGTKSLAITLASIVAFVLLSAWLTDLVLNRMTQPDGAIGKGLADNSLQATILAAIRSLAGIFDHTLLIYGIVYAAIGGLTLLALKFLWKQPVMAQATAAAKPMVSKSAKK